jgi:hypothetical protein
MLRSLLLSLVGAAALAACASEPAELADLVEPRVTILVEHDLIRITLEHDEECAHLGPRFNGTLNGRPMHVQSRGSECQTIELTAGYEIGEGPAHIHLEDPGAAIDVVYDHLLADGSVELIAPADGILFAGDRVELRWPHADDTLVHAQVGFEGAPPDLGWFVDEADVAGDRVTFTVPAVEGTWSAAPGRLLADVEIDAAPATRCEGVVSCTVRHTFIPFRRPVGVTYTGTPRP